MGDDTQKITDEDLDRAAEAPDKPIADSTEEKDGNDTEDTTVADQAADEPKEDEVIIEDEPIPDEPNDNDERSQLGRRVKAQEDNLTNFMADISQSIMDLQTTISGISTKDAPVVDDDDDEISLDLTLKEFNRRVDERADQRAKDRRMVAQQEKKDYETGYMGMVKTLSAGLPEGDKQTIETELFENKEINVRHSNNPAMDAELNFLRAQTNVLNKKLTEAAKPKNPLDKNKDNSDLKLGGPAETQNQDQASDKVVKLDAHAAEFVKKSGMSDEAVSKALNGPMPTYLGGAQ